MNQICPECGAQLPDGAPDAPCAACLMKLGMKSWQNGAGTHQEVLPTQSYVPPTDAPTPRELAAIFPQLEIVELVGQGGMGAVFKAVQKSLDRTVALKLIRTDAAKDPSFAERFVREAKALAQLSHPNIVTVYDFGQAEDYYYFIMEFVDGTNLRHLLSAKKMDPGTALTIVPRVCDALQYAHDRGIVHRDIKPENILVNKQDEVKIADFGLAKLVSKIGTQPTLTQTHHVMGTMHYMAPEQIEKPLTVDHRADIYSLGVVIYEMLTGELPIGRFAPPSQKVQVDVRLDEVVLHALEKEPALRFQQMSHVKTEVESIKSTPPQVMRQMQSAQASFKPPVQSPVGGGQSASAAAMAGRESPIVSAPLADVAGKPSYEMPVEEAPPTGFWGVVVDRQSWLNIGYLLLSFPLGIFYFVFLVTGFSTGFGLVVVWVGILVLLGTLLGVRGARWFERETARKALRVQLFDERRGRESQGIWEQVKRLFADSSTWTAVIFLLLKFPLGILSFVATVTLLATSISCVLALVAYRIPWMRMDFGPWEIDTLAEALPISILGILLLPISMHVLNGLTWIHKQLVLGLLNRRPAV